MKKAVLMFVLFLVVLSSFASAEECNWWCKVKQFFLREEAVVG